jgi:hypothetical protein
MEGLAASDRKSPEHFEAPECESIDFEHHPGIVKLLRNLAARPPRHSTEWTGASSIEGPRRAEDPVVIPPTVGPSQLSP